MAEQTSSILSILTEAEQADVTAGTNAIDITAKIQSWLANAPPGAVLDATALHGTVNLSADPFYGLHTVDATLKTGRVTLTINTSSSRIARPSLLNWVMDGTIITPLNTNGGNPPTPSDVEDSVVGTWTGETTCGGTPGSSVFAFGSTAGLHVGSRVAIAGNVLDASMVFTLSGNINSSALALSLSQNTAHLIAGTEVYLRIDDETMRCSIPYGSNTSVTVLERAVHGSTAASHSNGANAYLALALMGNVIGVSGSTVTLDTPCVGLCGGMSAKATRVRIGAYRSDIDIVSSATIDYRYDRYLTPFTVTISNASPAVITKTAHGLTEGTGFRLDTTGALPAGFSSGVTYYVLATGFTVNAFQASLTVGGSAIVTSSAGSGTHTVIADRMQSGQCFGMALARKCNVRGKLNLLNAPHGGAMLTGTADCNVEFGEIVHCARPVVGLGAGIWIFGANERTIVSADRVHDCNGGFFFDDKTESATIWGMDWPNINCHLSIGNNTGHIISGTITTSIGCTVNIKYQDASAQGVGIENDEGQRLTVLSDYCKNNTITVHASSRYLPPAGDAVGINGNNVILVGADVKRTITLGTTPIAANSSVDVSASFAEAIAGALVRVIPLADLPTGLGIGYARSQSDGNVKIRFTNSTAGSLSAAGSYLVWVHNNP